MLVAVAAMIKVFTVERPQAQQQEDIENRKQESEERKQIISTSTWWQTQVPPLQETIVLLTERLKTAEAKIATIENNYLEAHKLLLIKHAEEVASLNQLIAEQAIKLKQYELQYGALGVKP